MLTRTLATLFLTVSLLPREATALDSIPGLVPLPVQVKRTADKPFQVEAKLKIPCHNDLAGSAEAAAFLADYLEESSGVTSSIMDDGALTGRHGVLFTKGDGTLGTEGYTLSISESGVIIQADAPAGFFYAVQTLRQLLPPEATFDGKPEARPGFTLPAVEIKDQPAYRWRGLMLDVSRYFLDKEYVLHYLDIMAAHKLNVLHLHLIDDQGWRIEIKKYGPGDYCD